MIESKVRPEVGVAAIEGIVAVRFKQCANSNVHEFHLLLFGKGLVPHAEFVYTYKEQKRGHVHTGAKVFFKVFLKFLKTEFDVVIHVAKIRIERRL